MINMKGHFSILLLRQQIFIYTEKLLHFIDDDHSSLFVLRSEVDDKALRANLYSD